MRRKISAHVDGGLSGGSHVRRPGSKVPNRRERNFHLLWFGLYLFLFKIFPAMSFNGFGRSIEVLVQKYMLI